MPVHGPRRRRTGLRGARPRRRLAAVALVLALPLGGAPAPATEPVAERPVPDASEVLARALHNLNPTRHERVKLVNYSGSRRGFQRELELSILRKDDAYRVLGTFRNPARVRGTAFLILPPSEAAAETGRPVPSNDYFVYLPALSKVKRISGAQRGDSFFGTRLSQGDVEPHPAHHYRAHAVRESRHEGEAVYLLDAEPLFRAGYDRARLIIAQADWVILKAEQYRRGRERPIRTIETRREWIERLGDHSLPTRLVVVGPKQRLLTEVTFSDRELVAEIPTAIFSLSHLRRRGD